MKAISLKPAETALNFRITSSVSKFLTQFGLSIASISATVCFLAVLLDVDHVAYASAFIALGALHNISRNKEGGES